MPKFQTISQLIETFKEDYFNERGENPATLSTWKVNYQHVLNKLPPNRKLTETMLRELIVSTPANTRKRRCYALACSKLADHAEIDHNLRRLVGQYSTKKVNPRDVPDDETIVNCFGSIPNPQWQFVYGLMATYGIRNCEAFLAKFDRLPELTIQSAKGGEERLVYPLHPEWVNLFGLTNINLPDCSGKCNSDLGNRVGQAFKRYKLPFTAYNLRHAWARRAKEYGLTVETASVMMGHCASVHRTIYQRWITADVYRNEYNRAIQSPNRPECPLTFTVKAGDGRA